MVRSILARSVSGTSSFIFGPVRRSGWVCVCRDFGAESFWRSIGASLGYLSAVTGGRANYNFPFIIISRRIFWPALQVTLRCSGGCPTPIYIIMIGPNAGAYDGLTGWEGCATAFCSARLFFCVFKLFFYYLQSILIKLNVTFYSVNFIFYILNIRF